ncbi:DEDD exonuclease domain-containing protein [Rarobacter faecitabidus]|uniref:DNA polymerase-3 subunit epsilon n=1 Tax=Rarobacter faecitabidus TaxID=13243 RepID=A0A542ZVE8_RARFA|nr:DEDD exonuclease domain-containing protein [Rarobacter faecitabidus]TQL64335.1 DNA polymerase-3 subunit epsilon [Rarobacter faecitabidus]
MPVVPTVTAIQDSFEDLGESLFETTFVVVDLETTGGSPRTAAITEIGAVKVRGGVVLGEFQTLVNAGVDVPPFIAALTGITSEMLRDQPSLGQALASFLEFARGGVLVAHNAPFDIGFLKRSCDRLGYVWPGFEVVDTVPLARAVVPKDEVPNHKLETLARHFRATVTPEHRALADARATVDVLHALLERHASRGVTHRGDLATACARVPDQVRRRRTLADDLTTGAGVYIFRSAEGLPLYVGRSGNVRARVRQYFTAGERRGRIAEMVRLAGRVDEVPCASGLEARVRELRLIAELEPPYNRKSTRQFHQHWVTMSAEAHPRLIVTRKPPPAPAIGPFTSAARAREVVEAIQEAFDIRTCTTRLPLSPKPGAKSCARHEIGRCSAPCILASPAETPDVRAVQALLAGSVGELVRRYLARIQELAAAQRYEGAAWARDRLRKVLSHIDHSVWHDYLRSAESLEIASPVRDSQDVEIDVAVRGRHVGSARVPRDGIHRALEAIRLTADLRPPDLASAEEVAMLAEQLRSPGVRLLTAGTVPPFGNEARQALDAIFPADSGATISA